MKKKMLELLAKKKAIIDRMKQADAAADQAAFETAQADLAPVDAEIARVQAILDAEAVHITFIEEPSVLQGVVHPLG